MSVFPKKMIVNLDITKGLIFSQRVMIEINKVWVLKRKAYFASSKECT